MRTVVAVGYGKYLLFAVGGWVLTEHSRDHDAVVQWDGQNGDSWVVGERSFPPQPHLCGKRRRNKQVGRVYEQYRSNENANKIVSVFW